MVGNKPVVLEPISLRFARAQKRLGIARPFPARSFLGDAFDIFQETHRGDPQMLICGLPSNVLPCRGVPFERAAALTSITAMLSRSADFFREKALHEMGRPVRS